MNCLGPCRHCGERIYHNEGRSGRYRYTTKLDGTDIFGSGSECPKNDRGHEEPEPGSSYLQGDFGGQARAEEYADLWNEHQPWGEATYEAVQDGTHWRIRVTIPGGTGR